MMTVLIEALRAEDAEDMEYIIFYCYTYPSIEKQDKNDLINKDVSYCLNHFT